MNESASVIMAALTRIENDCAQVKLDCGEVKGKVDRMDSLLRGSDNGEHPGLLRHVASLEGRVTQIEKKETKREQISIGIIVAGAGMMVTTILALMQRVGID